jgi:glycosyltransferase involved in cell wall biosynthesis
MSSPPERHACMLAYTFYETDGRVMRYAETLARAGYWVDAITLKREGQPSQENINGVMVWRIQQRLKNERSKASYLWRILQFFFRSMVFVSKRHWQKSYDLIHVHSVPDFEVFATLLPKLGKTKVILDIHDIVPEFYAAKFNVGQKSLTFVALKILEKLSCAFADHVIIANDLWREKLTQRSTVAEKCSSFINYPDLSVFQPGLRSRQPDDKFIVLYPGTLNWHQGLDIAINAFDKAKKYAPGMELHIYGEGSAREDIVRLIAELNLSRQVFLHAPLPLKQVARVMADADVGIVPKRNDSFGGEAFSTKILEFMALGVPVIAADTKVDTYYFNDSLLKFFRAGDVDSLADALLENYLDRDTSSRRVVAALEYAKKNSWQEKQADYLGVVQSLITRSAGRMS